MKSKDRDYPFWSVMIPTYNPPSEYLRQALRSVLEQDPGPEQMQIEVVDDCSPKVDVGPLVREIAGERVGYFRNPENVGLAGCWNACTTRAQGVWVHILHQDDYVLPGFYNRLEVAARSQPSIGLVATRSFGVDSQGFIESMTPRLAGLENGSRRVDAFFYSNPLRCPAVAVKRSFYEEHGRFRTDLPFTLDWEMWVRAISRTGGLVTSEILAAHRRTPGNETERFLRSAEGMPDVERLQIVLAGEHPEMDLQKAHSLRCADALLIARNFAQVGDRAAAAANLRYWKNNASIGERVHYFVTSMLRKAAAAF
jgi:glycosyltransferase involved in cell wall biosynthesis